MSSGPPSIGQIHTSCLLNRLCNKKWDHRPFFPFRKYSRNSILSAVRLGICIRRKPSAVPDIIFRIPRQPDLFFRIQHIRSHSPRFSPAPPPANTNGSPEHRNGTILLEFKNPRPEPHQHFHFPHTHKCRRTPRLKFNAAGVPSGHHFLIQPASDKKQCCSLC